MKLKMFFLIILILLLAFACYLFVGKREPTQDIVWGVNFSQKQAQYYLSSDWQKTYSALIDDLNIKHLKLGVYWDLIEPEKDNYLFECSYSLIEKSKIEYERLEREV